MSPTIQGIRSNTRRTVAHAPAGARSRRCWLVLVALLLASTATQPAAAQPPRYDVSGLVLKISPDRRSVIVSHDDIPGLMPAMTMPFDVSDPMELEGVAPGMTVRFTLVLGDTTAVAEGLEAVPYRSVEQDPLTARRLSLLRAMTVAGRTPVLKVSQPVPDFTLTNQVRQRVSLSELRGKVVAVNFIYTSCALPQFCFRVANHFGVVQRRFADRAGRDLVLLTITFDPARDTPERLAEYASQWKADPASWQFLTGSVPEIRRVCSLFGVDFFPDEGLMNHTVRTAVIDREGTLVAHIEGNRYSAAQLGDLIGTVLDRR